MVVHGRRLVLAVGVLNGLLAAGYGVMFSVLDDFRDEYGISPSALGLIVGVGFFASFATQILLAPQADRGHARLLVCLGMGLSIAGLLGMAVGRSVGVLLLARIVMGVGAGAAIPALRRMVILAEPDQIGHNIGVLLSADVSGFALGPAVSAVLVGPFGIPSPFLLIAAATLACYPIIARISVSETVEATSSRLAFDLFRIRAFAGAVVLGMAVFLMIGTFDALWVLVLSDLRASDWIANIGITLFALPLIVMGAAGGRMAQRFGPFRVATLGLTLGAMFMFLYGQMPSGGAMFAVAMFHAVNDGLTVSSTSVAASMAVAPERQAGAQGMLGGVQVLVGGITAIVAGSLYDSRGRTFAYTTCAVSMVVVVIAGALLAGRSYFARQPTPDVLAAS